MYNVKLNKRTLVMAAMAIMLLATTGISMATTENVFAFRKTQATALPRAQTGDRLSEMTDNFVDVLEESLNDEEYHA
jgi:hypothetical protein